MDRTGKVWREDAHLGEERFIALLGEYDRLGGEERDQRGLRAAYQQQIADAHKAPRSAPSMSAWNAERERRWADRALIEERLKRTDERLKEIASRRQEILVKLVREGMPKDRWIGYGEHYVLVRRKLDDKPYGQAPGAGGEDVFGLELRRVLREALDKAPEGAPVGEIERRSERLERLRAMGPTRRIATRASVPVLTAGVLGGVGYGGFLLLERYGVLHVLEAVGEAVGFFLVFFVFLIGTAAFMVAPFTD